MAAGLFFDIDAGQLREVAAELAASERQVKLALSAALRRTATTLRVLAARGLKNELQLRTIGLLRKRLKQLRLRMTNGDGVQLWFGLNDIPASWFKGRPKQTATGAVVRGKQFDGAFVARSQFKGRRTAFKRTGKARLHIEEQLLPIEDQAVVFLEDSIFDQTETIFWKHFRRDLAARVSYNIGER